MTGICSNYLLIACGQELSMDAFWMITLLENEFKQALEEEYQEYHNIGGNGVGTQMYESIMALPTEPPEENIA